MTYGRILDNHTVGFGGFDYDMQAWRTYSFSGVQNGGYVVPRPPDPPGTRLPLSTELRERRAADAQREAELLGS
eukprot:5953111-Alexandrium_andersonii.AAC.1